MSNRDDRRDQPVAADQLVQRSRQCRHGVDLAACPDERGERQPVGDDVAAPWELESENLQTLEEMRRRVLATQDFFLDPSREFSDIDAPDDHKALFSLHQGLKRLVSLAEEAKDKTTTDARRTILEKAFQNGLDQLDDYFQGMDLEELTVLKGKQLSKIESDVAVSRGLSQFKSGIIHTGEYDAEVPSLTGDVRFTISIKKSGVTTDVEIDLADMGGQTRNLDNIVAHINSELEAAGMVTRFERTKIGEENDIGVIPGNDHGFLIRGVSTEQLSFTAPAAEPALYFAGVSGINETAGGQIVKLKDLASGDPQVGYSTRFGADPTETEVDVIGSGRRRNPHQAGRQSARNPGDRRSGRWRHLRRRRDIGIDRWAGAEGRTGSRPRQVRFRRESRLEPCARRR